MTSQEGEGSVLPGARGVAPPTNNRPGSVERGFRRAATVAGAYAVIGAGVTLLGWILHVPRLTDWQGHGISMKGNAAVCALLSGFGLLLSLFALSAPIGKRVIRAIALFVSLLAAATLVEHAFAIDFGIDTLAFDEAPGAAATAAPGRMGVPASLSFTLFGVALWLAGGRPRERRWSARLGLTIICIAALPLVGYFYGASQLFAFARFTGIAWQTATMIAMLAVGVVAAVPEYGLAAALRLEDVGGMAFRRLFVAIVVFPIGLGWLRVVGQEAGLYDTAFGTALRTLIEIVVLVGLLWWTALRISRHAATARDAEKALGRNETRLSAFLEQLPVGCCLSDRDGRPLVRNLVMQRFDAAELIAPAPGAGPGSDAPHHWRATDAAGAPLPRAEWPTARALRGEVVSPAVDFIYADKERRETWTRVSSTPFHDESGAIVGAITVVEDINARKQADESLREREALLRTVTTESNVGLVLLDPDRRYVFANATYANILALADAHVVGKTVEQVLGALYKQVRPNLDRAFAGERLRYELHLPVHPRTGVEHFYDVSYEPRFNGAAVSHVAVVVIDVTARKNAETALRDADRRKDEFLAMLAHELRNPLAPLRSGLAMLRRTRGDDPPGVVETQQMMERQLAQMVRLVDDLIDVSRISRGKIDLRRAPTLVSIIIDTAVETARPLIEAFGHKLSIRQPEAPITLDVDLTRLAQVLANLLSNAAKYTPPGGIILLTVENDGDEVVVTVRDDGIGIPAAMLPEIFDTFTQVDTSLERSRGGLGIGLTVVKRLVEMHGGTVAAFSPPLVRGDGPRVAPNRGQGSEFVVRLPVGRVPAAAGAASATATNQTTATATATMTTTMKVTTTTTTTTATGRTAGVAMTAGRLRVLVADDNIDGADALGMLLDEMGMETQVTYDGQAALDAASRFMPDLLLLDIGMPKLNGYEVGRRVRAQDWGRRAVMVAVTGWGEPDDRKKSAAAGFDHHMVKPLDVDDLERLLAGVQPMSR